MQWDYFWAVILIKMFFNARCFLFFLVQFIHFFLLCFVLMLLFESDVYVNWMAGAKTEINIVFVFRFSFSLALSVAPMECFFSRYLFLQLVFISCFFLFTN